MSSQSNIVPLRQSYQIKVLLSNIKPPIWRRLVIDSRVPLSDLHDVIQISMGWTDSHMHQYIDRNGIFYSEPYDTDFAPSFGRQMVDESEVLLHEVLKEEKDWIKYEYDFGDGWEHKIILEKILAHQKNQFPMVCIKGRRACPPEDCGGPWGYQHLLEQIKDPESEEDYEALMEWLEDNFEPEFFDLEEVNALLEEIFEGEIFNGKGGLDKELKRIESTNDDAIDEPGLENMSLEDFALDPLGFDDLGLPGYNRPGLGETGLDGAILDLLNNPDLPDEIKQLVGGMMEAVDVVNYMSGLIDQSIEAFEHIADHSKDKKIKALANKMLKVLDDEIDD